MKFQSLTIPTMLLNVSLWCAVLKSSSIRASAFGLATSSSSATSVSVVSNRAIATSTSQATSSTTSTALGMAQQRGLEQRQEGASPMEGGMELYCKAGPDGTAVGDCPFAHYVRLVLEEKGLDYELKPVVPETKPVWLMEYYQGKMPALRHRKECYVDSDVICEYLDFFFPGVPLNAGSKQATELAVDATAGLFPAIAKYLKHTPDGDAEDTELLSELVEKLTHLETFLTNKKNQLDADAALFIVGDQVTLQDCSLAPKLYHLQSGVEAFKGQAINIPVQYPAVQCYMDGFFARDSFQNTSYPKEMVAWGWGNARK